jgi:pSer/pThr/pTyr-binding forkhead associated (FHA) protein
LPVFVLTVLKILFLALLYFFVYRALHAVVVDLRPTPSAPAARAGAGGAAAPKGRGRGDKPPRSVVILDERGGKVGSVALDGNLQIGRAEACQIRPDDTYISSFHARIFRRDDGWYVEDLGSTNGTYLNQRRVTSPAELRAGDRLKVGKTTLELRR